MLLYGFTVYYIVLYGFIAFFRGQPSSIRVIKRRHSFSFFPGHAKSPLLLCKPNGTETVVKFGAVPTQLLRCLQRDQGFRVTPRHGQSQAKVLLGNKQNAVEQHMVKVW
jgi:hypothetical protein